MMIPHHSPPVAGTLRCRLASGGERPQGWHLCETCIAMPTISDIAAKTSSWGGFISQFQWQCFIHGRYDNSPGSMKPADFHLRHENRLEDKSSLFPSLFIIYSHQSPLFSIIIHHVHETMVDHHVSIIFPPSIVIIVHFFHHVRPPKVTKKPLPRPGDALRKRGCKLDKKPLMVEGRCLANEKWHVARRQRMGIRMMSTHKYDV